jgi:hypothetical protein
MKEFTARGSWGNVVADAVTGDVLRIEDEPVLDPGEVGYGYIVRLDVDEYRTWSKSKFGDKLLDEGDILDIGFWNKEGCYAEPVEESRNRS